MKKIVLGLITVALAFACTSVSDKTTLKGKFSGTDVPEEVHIQVPGQVDTIVKLKNASFQVSVPINKLAMSTLTLGDKTKYFISDGTVLTFSKDDTDILVKSNKPSASLNTAFNNFDLQNRELMAEYRTTMQAIADSTGLTAEQVDSLQEDFYNSMSKRISDLNKQTLAANTDNILGIAALRDSYYEYNDKQLDSLLNTLDSAVLVDPFVQKLSTGLQARKNTAEGLPFTDFTVMQPNNKEVRFSDYIGNGKYVLVDFWASWCGPCKREIPYLKDVYNEFKGKDFDVLSVAVWDKPQASVDTAKAYGVKWDQILDAQSVPTDIYGIQGIPHIILFGPDGTILKRDLRGEAISEEVAKYIKR